MSDALARLLVAVDGSDAADRALSLAIELGRVYDAELLLCHAIDPTAAFVDAPAGYATFPALLIDEMNDAATSILAVAEQRATSAGVRVSATVLGGTPPGAIVACAEDRVCDAIVVGTQGKRGLERLFLGSTAKGVLRLANVPVFVVVPSTQSSSNGREELESLNTGFQKIFVAMDHSDSADGAAAFALALAAAGKSTLTYCNVLDAGDLIDTASAYGYDPRPMLGDMHRAAESLLATVADEAARQNVAASRIVAEGNPIVEILKNAEAEDADLIAIGTHGRRGLRRLFLGSVAEGVVRSSSMPVVVVRSDDETPKHTRQDLP